MVTTTYAGAQQSTRRPRLRFVGSVSAACSVGLTVVAALLVWFFLVAPDHLDQLSPTSLVRLPVEAVAILTLVLLLPPRLAQGLALLAGLATGLLALVKVLDTGFSGALGRPFNPAVDLGYLGSAVSLLGDSFGRTQAMLAAVLAGVATVAVLVLTPLAALRVTGVARRHRGAAWLAVAALALAWLGFSVSGLRLPAGPPVATNNATALAVAEGRRFYAGIKDQQAFAQSAAHDAFSSTPGADLLTGLRGKDVLVVFVESYGRVAVQGSSFSPQIVAELDAGTRQLAASGYTTRSAFLTSPTYGGASWLAHSTFESGLWIDSQPRYDKLMTTKQMPLSVAFKRAGWRAVADIPPDNRDWPQGRSYYHYDTVYDSRNVGYRGPKFSYAPVPDQYTFSAFRRLELARSDRKPVMAEIDLVSSHSPWTPLPHLLPWDQLGDGSVYDGMPAQGKRVKQVWPDAAKVQEVYGQSIQYSLASLISFLTTYPDPNLVLLVLGDHQPAAIVSGTGSDHDVPITVIASDPAVIDRISPWHWQPGLRPHPNAPVWPMDTFRNRFLAAYGPRPGLSR